MFLDLFLPLVDLKMKMTAFFLFSIFLLLFSCFVSSIVAFGGGYSIDEFNAFQQAHNNNKYKNDEINTVHLTSGSLTFNQQHFIHARHQLNKPILSSSSSSSSSSSFDPHILLSSRAHDDEIKKMKS